MKNPELKGANLPSELDGDFINWKEIPGVEKVWGFEGEHLALSNYSYSPMQVNGRTYDNAAFAHQALRFSLPDAYGSKKPDSGDRYTGEVEDYLTAGWDGDDIEAMEYVLRIKFDPELHPENAKVLLDTGDRPLVAAGEEGFTTTGEMWGVDEEGWGDNVIGRILMDIRRDLEDRELLEDKHESDRRYFDDRSLGDEASAV